MIRSAIVVGGGIVGLSSALCLQRHGFDVTVLEPDAHRRAASWGNAGHIAVEQVEPLASWATIRSVPRRLFCAGGALALPPRDIGHWLPFSLAMTRAANRIAVGRQTLAALLAQAMPAWRTLVASLGAPNVLREDGHFVLWETESSARAGLAGWRRADTGTARFRIIETDELASFAKILRRPPVGGIRFENTGQIVDPIALSAALEQSVVQGSGRLLRKRASALVLENGSVRVVLEGGEMRSADCVVIAAGVRSRELLHTLGVDAPLIAERGYHIQASEDAWPDLPPGVFEDRAMIVTRFTSGLRIASFVEFANPNSPPDPRKWARLHRHAQALGLPSGTALTQWMGSRPTLPDYLPAIGRSRLADNLIYAFGHQHLGLTLAPLTGEIVAALATRSAPPVDIGRCDLERFSNRRE
jgi:D-hydroxyproline dehydrogenase